MADAKDRYSDARQHPQVDGSRRARKLALLTHEPGPRRGSGLYTAASAGAAGVVRRLRAGR
jgi:hypothetical protein